jgi:hypothetical protein
MPVRIRLQSTQNHLSGAGLAACNVNIGLLKLETTYDWHSSP